MVGTFIAYDVTNNPTGPVQNGFSAGFFTDESQVYVGHSNCGACRAVCAGRIDVITMAGYASCNGNVFPDNTTAAYVVTHPNLKWVAVSLSTFTNVAKRIPSPGGGMFYGKITQYVNNIPVAYVGKVNPKVGLVYYANGKDNTAKNFDILSC